MEQFTTYRSPVENQRVYDLIWSQMPHMQNRTSSSWWFFMLFPKDGEVYGQRQLMFAIATRVGDRIRVNDVWLPGLDLGRPILDGVDRFAAMSVGWYCDGETVHHDILKQAADTTLSLREGVIRCWSDEEDETGYGLELRKSATHPLGLAANVRGRNGSAQFEAWGDLDGLHSSPHESLDIDTPLGGTHFIAWRRMHFAGTFDLPGGKETLSGIAYFQRVCLNVPAFPWKWIWAVFPNGAMFSSYVPYVGLNLLRKGYTFFESNWKEQAAIDIAAAGFWDWPGPAEQILFNEARITPILGEKAHPNFLVQVRNKRGDFLSFLAAPYGQTRFFIDRPVLGGRLEMHWSYNEYMFRMEQLAGRVSGQAITRETMGQAHGTLEYTYGLGL
jgi:hypothetical protein